jgi:hypothetical protein
MFKGLKEKKNNSGSSETIIQEKEREREREREREIFRQTKAQGITCQCLRSCKTSSLKQKNI